MYNLFFQQQLHQKHGRDYSQSLFKRYNYQHKSKTKRLQPIFLLRIIPTGYPFLPYLKICMDSKYNIKAKIFYFSFYFAKQSLKKKDIMICAKNG